MWKNEGVDPEHIQIMGMEDNFWTTGGLWPWRSVLRDLRGSRT